MSIIIPFSWNNNNSGNEKADTKTTLTVSPAEVTLSENMKSLTFEPVETTTTQSKATLIISIYQFIAEDETITFSFLDSNLILTAKVLPTSGEFLTESVAPTGAALNEYFATVAESIADTLKQILSFDANYTILVTGAQIGIEANSYGSEFNISATSTAIIYNTSIAGSSKFLSQNVIDYSAFAELYIGSEVFAENVDKFLSIPIDEYLIDSSTKKASISVNPVGDFVQPILPIKQPTQSSDFFIMDTGTTGAGVTIPTEDENGLQRFVLRPYFVVYGDSFRFIENGQRKRFVKGVSPVRWVQLGSFDKIRPYDMNNYIWLPDTDNSFNWLSSCPNNKSVTYDSHAFLQVICRKTSTTNITANIEVKYNFYDGTFEIVQLNTFNFLDSNIAGNLSFDVSPFNLGIEDYEVIKSKQVESYEVKLKWTAPNGINGKSEIRKYIFDRNCYDQQNQIIFLNEFGAWDSIGFRGSVQQRVSRETKTITRVLPFNSNTESAISSEVSLNIDTKVQVQKSLHSGLMTQIHYDWAKKILESSSIYIWNANLSAYESILIDGYNYSPDTKDGGGSISIDYVRTTDSNSIKR